jgi:hypothetical protein
MTYEVDWQRKEDGDGRTCAHVAAQNNHGAIVKLLFEEEWNLNLPDLRTPPMTPIDYAYAQHHYELANAMRLAGNHNLLLIEAIKRKHDELVLEVFKTEEPGHGLNLLEFRFPDLTSVKPKKGTPRKEIKLSYDAKIIRPNLFGPASPYIRLKCRKDYMHLQKNEMIHGYKKTNRQWLVSRDDSDCFLVPEGYVKEVDYIVDYVEGDTSMRKGDGCTALHAAAKLGNKKVVQILLENGWSPTKRNRKGLTPIDVAVESNFHTLAGILRVHNDCNGLLYAAIENGNHIKERWTRQDLPLIRLRYDFNSGGVVGTINKDTRAANFGVWSNGTPITVKVVEAHFVVEADGQPRMLAKRGDLLTTSTLCKDSQYLCRHSDSLELFKIPKDCVQEVLPRYHFDWVSAIEKKNVLQKAEIVHLSLHAVADPSIVKTLFHYGWSHCNSKDWRKNHNLLLIKALSKKKWLPHVLSHLEKNTMIRCNPSQDENSAEISLLPDSGIWCPVGMLTLQAIYGFPHECQRKTVVRDHDLEFKKRQTLHVLLNNKPFVKKRVLRGNVSVFELLYKSSPPPLKIVHLECCKLAENQIGTRYVANYRNHKNESAIDVIRKLSKTADKGSHTSELCDKITTILRDRGWCDWHTAKLAAIKNLNDIKSKIDKGGLPGAKAQKLISRMENYELAVARLDEMGENAGTMAVETVILEYGEPLMLGEDSNIA